MDTGVSVTVDKDEVTRVNKGFTAWQVVLGALLAAHQFGLRRHRRRKESDKGAFIWWSKGDCMKDVIERK